jgi:glycosyltransferase involved in cell wall biosynthesis
MTSTSANGKIPSQSSLSIPQIAPVPEGTTRPFWSVMIPTFNCAKYLRQTLESVLAQDPGPELMQIEVVDDVSTKDDPEAVVREIGKGRVQFYRHKQNLGAIRNFNSCLSRARGHWVHILHGDDYVLPGFYDSVQGAIEKYPHAGGVFARVFFVDEPGEITHLSPRVQVLEQFGTDALGSTIVNPFQCPGVVLNRKFVEEEGGFDVRLIHVADWEMWVRVINRRGAVFINRPLACYREFAANDSSRLKRTAENLRDYLRVKAVFAATVPGFRPAEFDKKVYQAGIDQVKRFQTLGDVEAEVANRAFLRSNFPFWARLVRKGRNAFRRLIIQ